MNDALIVRYEDNLWTCVCEDGKFENVGFIDLVMMLERELGIRKFTLQFDCEGKAIDGATATFDFGAPDTYVPD